MNWSLPVGILLFWILFLSGVSPVWGGGSEGIRPGSGHFPGLDLVEVEAPPSVQSLPEESLLSPQKRRFGFFLFAGLAGLFLVLRAWVGSRRGWLQELGGIAPVALFLYLIFRAQATHTLLQWVEAEGNGEPGWMLHLMAGAFLLGALYLIFSLSAFLLTRILGRGIDGQLKTTWRIGGAVAGAMVGSCVLLVILIALYTFSTFAWFFHSTEERPHFLTRFLLTSRQTIEQSFLAPLIIRLEPLQAHDYSTLETIRLAHQENILARLSEDPSGWAELAEIASVQAILENESLLQRLEEGRYLTLLMHPGVYQAVRDPQVHETIQRLASPRSNDLEERESRRNSGGQLQLE